MPKSRTDYWIDKIEGNKRRDARKRRQLRTLGWEVVVVWECEMKNPDKLAKKLQSALDQ